MFFWDPDDTRGLCSWVFRAGESSKGALRAEVEVTRRVGKRAGRRQCFPRGAAGSTSQSLCKVPQRSMFYKGIIRMSQNTQCGTIHMGTPEMSYASVPSLRVP